MKQRFARTNVGQSCSVHIGPLSANLPFHNPSRFPQPFGLIYLRLSTILSPVQKQMYSAVRLTFAKETPKGLVMKSPRLKTVIPLITSFVFVISAPGLGKEPIEKTTSFFNAEWLETVVSIEVKKEGADDRPLAQGFL